LLELLVPEHPGADPHPGVDAFWPTIFTSVHVLALSEIARVAAKISGW